MQQPPDNFPQIQGAIYGVALSLEAFLLNGIPYGVLQQVIGAGFLQKTAGNLLRELESLESQAAQTPVSNRPKVREVLAALRAKCQQLIDLVTGLGSFRTLPLQQVRAAVAQIPTLRGECVQRIQELEACFQTPKPFYQSRPAHSTAMVNHFLTDLEPMFTEEWAAANAQPIE